MTGTPAESVPALTSLSVATSAEGSPAPSDLQPVRSIESLPRLPQSIFSALRSLFLHISLNVEEKGMVSPSAFIAALKKENVDFRTSQHQDAHEFLNYLLNRVAEDIDENRTRPTMVQSLFEGLLTNETRCLSCNTVSHRDETFLDLSIDIEPNSSVTACLREFSKGEMLLEDNRFRCDHCNEYCDAEKRMKVKTLPNVLALHLKRFKYIEDANRNIRPTKLTYRVAFPLELRLFDTSDDAQNPDRLYELFAIVVHIGAGLAHGHYVTVVRTQGKWVLFDDEAVDVIKESDIMKYFGDAPGGQGYVLFYQAVDMDIHALGLPDRLHHAAPKTTIPPPAFPPEWSSEKQFADHGVVYTPYAGTSQAQAAASLVPLPPPAPTPPTPVAAHPGRKGLKLDIPATPKFDASATLNSLRGLTGPLTMPAQGSREQNGGFFSRTPRHSQSRLDKASSAQAPISPLTALPPSGGLPPTAPPQLKARPSSRGKDAAAWLAGKMGKEKRREGEEAAAAPGTGTGTPMPKDDAPPVPPLPPLPIAPINGAVSENALVGLGIHPDQKRPSLPASLERVQEAMVLHPPPPQSQEDPLVSVHHHHHHTAGVFPHGASAPVSARTSGMLSPPTSPSAPLSPSSRTSSSLQAAPILESPTEDSTGTSQSVEAKSPHGPSLHRKRPSTAGGKLSNGPLTVRPPEETNGTTGFEKIRGRRASRDDAGDRPKWYKRIGKKERPSTASGKLEDEDDYAVENDVIEISVSGGLHSFEPPMGRHHYVPPPTLTSTPTLTGPTKTSTPDVDTSTTSIDNSSSTSSDERADRTGPLPQTPFPTQSMPPPSFPSHMSAPTSPNHSHADRPPDPPKAKRKLSMHKPALRRLSWFGSNNNLKEPVDASDTVPPLTPTEKKSRIPLGR
ncbi:hypothetical protein DACRYDRAFT_78606 [Dacryopinax primogenitus]|uniref:ubiquitinyl hydrolase 1 n=1 Tax=Dacryopinax primogenitus (strain DJM 731) TaxID=1858805 RepID=M5GDW5_DACPD|nr:uncharacterized protein DACRYDRAFT_78606 [Dacryopinax primogenitus]EJU02748.1 hypothetical protein DACRYDRAFT_78606 [Dacryopinax primogenitus]